VHAVVALLDGIFDLGGGLFGRLGATLGQIAHLIRHDRETHAGFPGAGGFHGRIEREDVGLEGDLVDRLDDLGDLGAR
jgi:hypothetical protein